MDQAKVKRVFKEWILPFAIEILVVFLLIKSVFFFATVPTGSMIPTIMAKTRVIGSRLSYINSDPERGDVVIFHFPDDPTGKTYYVKRIIGLPGETVDIVDGKVYIDGSDTPLEEPYLAEPMEGSWGPYEEPEGSYFMMGDNRNNSLDARYWENQYVKKDKIIAKVLFCYFPKFKKVV